jgi:hypothetical protein
MCCLTLLRGTVIGDYVLRLESHVMSLGNEAEFLRWELLSCGRALNKAVEALYIHTMRVCFSLPEAHTSI